MIRVGFVPLLDAAPLIVAQERGYFADEGLRVALERQIGWGNVRDKLVHGQLHASHALCGMPPLSVLSRDGFSEPLVSIIALGSGGDAITLSRRLTDAGVDTATALGRRLRPRPSQLPVLAHVFGCSVHHYLLRDWLSTGGVDPDRDVRLIVLPPPQMARQMAAGMVEGYCAGEPWNTLAESEGFGWLAAATTQLLPSHPDKVLAVSRWWLAAQDETATAMVRATLRGCAFCDDGENLSKVAEMLARPAYLDMPAALLLKSLKGEHWRHGGAIPLAEPMRSCAPAATFPSATHAAWLLGQMVRWGHVPQETDLGATARAAVDTSVYRRAAEALSIDCPTDDFPPMRVRGGGWFALKNETSAMTDAVPAGLQGAQTE